MTTFIVNIENEKDESGLTEYLNGAGLTYKVDEEYDEGLEASLAQGLKESAAGLGRPHSEVWPEIMARFKK